MPDGELYLFRYFEYTDENFQQVMDKMAADPLTQKWWAECIPCQGRWLTAQTESSQQRGKKSSTNISREERVRHCCAMH